MPPGKKSPLTSPIQSNNISAAQIRDDFERRQAQSARDENAAAGPSTTEADPTEDDAAVAAELDEQEQKTKKRKRSEKEAIDKIKKSKAKKSKKKGKKGDGDDDDDDDDAYNDDDFARDMYKKAKPAPGQFAHCELCDKRFTVTPYSKEGPDGGLLCTPCGKVQTKDQKKEQKALAPKVTGKKRRKLESDKLDGIAVGGAKTLKQLCIEKVVKHHEDVDELGDMPQEVIERLSMIFSKKRVMTSKTLPLFLRPDHDTVVVHDAAYLEEEDYHQMFAVVPHVKKLILSNACRFKDDTVEYLLDRCKNINHLHLYAANLVTDGMWNQLFLEAGPKFEVVKLKWLDAAFDDASVATMVENCPKIHRLKFKLCRRLGQDSINSISNLTQLEHLSLHINNEVSAEALVNLIQKRGSALRTLSLEKFIDADDTVIAAIHSTCNRLIKLRFSENDYASDAAYVSLFTNWTNPALTFVDLDSTRDVDNNNADGPENPIGLASAGFKALMAHSGPALKHLDIASCRHVTLSAFLDVFSGEHTYPKLEYVNISFCPRADTSVVAGIFKSCPALKQLVAFGCFEIANVVVPRDVALIGVPKAQDAIEQFGVGIEVDDAIMRMVEVQG